MRRHEGGKYLLATLSDFVSSDVSRAKQVRLPLALPLAELCLVGWRDLHHVDSLEAAAVCRRADNLRCELPRGRLQ